MAIGVASRFPEHLQYFEPAYYEVKGTTGVWHDPPASCIPMVSVFADERVARQHPEWIQVDKDLQKATRDSQYFDWTLLCPSWPEVRDQAWAAIHQAYRDSGENSVRLDDVNYAREGFCDCQACQTAGSFHNDFREETITSFIRRAHEMVPHLEMTLYPDPYPLHLERRFGVNIKALEPYIDRWIVPLYDMHYQSTYWLEILASAFKDRLTKPFLIELYGLKVPEERLLKAARVAKAYADGVVIAYDNDLSKLLRISSGLDGV